MAKPYVGFWRRVVAFVIDGFLMVPVIGAALGLLHGLIGEAVPMFGQTQQAVHPGGEPTPALGWTTTAFADALALVGFGLYFALMESSARQATLGKMAVGGVVTDQTGRRLSFAHATGRYCAKIVSGTIFMLGFLMVAFSERKQGLHDHLAGTLVVDKGFAEARAEL